MGYRTAILIFDDVEVLDFAGPFEVFSVTGRRQKLEPFDVYTVAERPGPVAARNGLSINPRYSFADCPAPEILVVPGGYGTRREMKNPAMIEWISRVAPDCQLVLSVCTGALVLGTAGLLDGREATTHFMAFDRRQRRDRHVPARGRALVRRRSRSRDRTVHGVRG